MVMFEEAILFLEELGLSGVILPFILIFTIIFGMLEKIKITGKGEKKNINAMIAFVIGFMFIASTQRVDSLWIMLQYVALFMIINFSILLLIGTLTKEWEVKSKGTIYIITAIVLAVIVYYALDLSGYIKGETIIGFITNPWLITTIILVAVIWLVVRGEEKKKSKEKKEEAEEKKKEGKKTEKTKAGEKQKGEGRAGEKRKEKIEPGPWQKTGETEPGLIFRER